MFVSIFLSSVIFLYGNCFIEAFMEFFISIRRLNALIFHGVVSCSSTPFGFFFDCSVDCLFSSIVEGTFDVETGRVHDMEIHHRRRNIGVAQQVLHAPHVITGFKQMGGKGVA